MERDGVAGAFAHGMTLDDAEVMSLRRDFPILSQSVRGHDLVYLDNAATTQVPSAVLERISKHYLTDNANVHRGVHALARRSTEAFEQARVSVASFINAESEAEIVFTRGTTDSVNMVASSFLPELSSRDAVVVTELEHHSNFVPWQQLCKRTGARFLVAPIDQEGDVDLDAFEQLMVRNEVSLVAVAYVSNVLGTVAPVAQMAEIAHGHGALMLCDAAQAMRHGRIDVQEIDCDFLCFSGHKLLAPAGIGVLYGKQAILDALHPVSFGGEMVDIVSSGGSTFAPAPLRFESGTPNYVGAIALEAALRFIEAVGRERIALYEKELIERTVCKLRRLERVEVLGDPSRREGCVSFIVEGLHPFDVAMFLDLKGFAVRSGSMCAQPLLRERFGYESVLRVSPAFYNTRGEIDAFAQALSEVIELLVLGVDLL